MRNVDAKNQIWYVNDGAVTRIGLTKSFIDSLEECWQILPANTREFKKKSPLFMVETNDSLISIMSPVNGHMQKFETMARDFPDHLTEETVILELTENSTSPSQRHAGQAVSVGVEQQFEGLGTFIQGNAAGPRQTGVNTTGARPRNAPGLQFDLPSAAQVVARHRAEREQVAVDTDWLVQPTWAPATAAEAIRPAGRTVTMTHHEDGEA